MLSPDQSDALIARLEDANARAYEREKLTHKATSVDGQPSNPAHDISHHPSDNARLPSSLTGDRALLGRPNGRRFFSILLLLCVGITAIGWQSSYGYVVKQKFVEWAPEWVPTLSQPIEDRGVATVVHRDDPANTPTSRMTPPALTSEETKSTNAAAVGELRRLIQAMAHDLVTLGQRIEDIKAKQARDSAKVAEQLDASQERMARDTAKNDQQFKTIQEQAAYNNAKVAEQLQANLEQMAHDKAKIAEQFRIIQEQAARNKPTVVDQLEANHGQMDRVIGKTSKRDPRAKTSAWPLVEP
jgi:hypothetical protein